MTGWTKHDSSEPPELALAAIVWVRPSPYRILDVWGRVDEVDWHEVSEYKQPTDEDGIPYTSADGLEEWARYAATDMSGTVLQLDTVPQDTEYGDWLPVATWLAAPETHRHPGDWRESLYRVWRGK